MSSWLYCDICGLPIRGDDEYDVERLLDEHKEEPCSPITELDLPNEDGI